MVEFHKEENFIMKTFYVNLTILIFIRFCHEVSRLKDLGYAMKIDQK